MGHRSILVLTGVLLACLAPQVFSLGLGKITLDSALNQPLVAEIELFEVRDLTEDQIRVTIASREDHERIGVDKTFFLSDLRFDIVLDGPGAPKVNVTSTKSVREPFLNFVVQVQWPSGKLLREYTLLMDLPVYAQEPTPSVRTTTAAPAARPAPPPSTPSTSSGSVYNPRSAFEGAPPRPSAREVVPTYTDDSYRVQANDTLWEIATMVRPDRDVSIHQTMLAIQRSNPEAFINNNINLLKQGQILRIPDRSEMASLGQRDAVREVAVQNAAWSGGEVSDAQLSATSDIRRSASTSREREGRVRLSSPDELYDSAEGRSSGGSAASSTEALENELAITLEQLDKSSRDNNELRSKVASLEEQIQTMERMLEVSNENLRAMELAAKQNADAQDAAADDLATASEDPQGDDELLAGDIGDQGSLADQVEQGLSGGQGDEFIEPETEVPGEGSDDIAAVDDATETTQDTQAVAEQVLETPAADPRRVVGSAPVQEKGFLDLILDNVLYIVGGVVAIAAAAFFFLRRKSEEEEDFDDFLQESRPEEVHETTQEIADTIEEDLDLGGFGEDYEEPESELEAEQPGLEPETEDVVAEADIYIAYGKLDQAEEMLIKALDKEPGDENARLKLLEVYASQGDAERFDPQYAKLRAIASPSVMERADSLRNSIPNIAEFDEGGFDVSDVAGAGATEEALSLDLDLGDSQPDSQLDEAFDLDLAEDTSSSDAGLDLGLDLPSEESESFDLDLELDDTSQGGGEFTLEDESTSLDLDLGDTADIDKESDLADLDLDLGSLDDELDLAADDDSTQIRGDEGGFELDADLEDLAAGLELGDESSSVSSDTVVNEALNDEYIEQKLSEESVSDLDLDEDLPLEEETEVAQTQTLDALDLDEDADLDLSSLDQELDALTSGLDLDSETESSMEEPVVDFDEFEDELEKNEAMAETVKAENAIEADVENMGEDGMFDQAISQVPKTEGSDLEFELPDVNPEDVGDDDLEFLSDSDETATKLDLARAYIDMGDQEGARDIIQEVLGEGNDEQKAEAQGLLSRIDA